jgi:hypothetical protein
VEPSSPPTATTPPGQSHLSKTDIVNGAISLYEFIDAQLRAGRDVLIRDNSTGQTEMAQPKS